MCRIAMTVIIVRDGKRERSGGGSTRSRSMAAGIILILVGRMIPFHHGHDLPVLPVCHVSPRQANRHHAPEKINQHGCVGDVIAPVEIVDD